MYEWVFDTLDGNVGTGVSVVRRDFDPSLGNPEPPRVTYLPIEPGESLAGGGRVFTGVLELRIDVNRTDAFGTGDTPEHAGPLHTLEDAVDALIDGAVPSLTGHTARALRRRRTRDGAGSTDVAARTLVYEYQVFEGFGGVPLGGDEGTMVITGYDGEVERWEINERKPINDDSTAREDEFTKYKLGDKTASMTIWFIPEETDIMFPALGDTGVSIAIHDGASFTDTIKIYQRQWGQSLGDPQARAVVMQAVIDDDSSPFLTGVIP